MASGDDPPSTLATPLSSASGVDASAPPRGQRSRDGRPSDVPRGTRDVDGCSRKNARRPRASGASRGEDGAANASAAGERRRRIEGGRRGSIVVVDGRRRAAELGVEQRRWKHGQISVEEGAWLPWVTYAVQKRKYCVPSYDTASSSNLLPLPGTGAANNLVSRHEVDLLPSDCHSKVRRQACIDFSCNYRDDAR